MQLGLLVVVVFLSSMDLTGSSKVVKGKRQRRSTYEMVFFFSAPRDALPFVQTGNVCRCAGLGRASWCPARSQSSPGPVQLCYSQDPACCGPFSCAGELQPKVHGKHGF